MDVTRPAAAEARKPMQHEFRFDARKNGFISGVEKVISSCDNALSLITCCGGLVITGRGLRISKYDQQDGNLSFEGEIDSFKYSGAKTPLLKRLFK